MHIFGLNILLFSELMEPSRVLKSLFWLTSLTGLGYTLFLVTTNNQETVKKVSSKTPLKFVYL